MARSCSRHRPSLDAATLFANKTNIEQPLVLQCPVLNISAPSSCSVARHPPGAMVIIKPDFAKTPSPPGVNSERSQPQTQNNGRFRCYAPLPCALLARKKPANMHPVINRT